MTPRRSGNRVKMQCPACTARRLAKLRAANPGYSTGKNRDWNAANPEKRAVAAAGLIAAHRSRRAAR